MKIQYKATAIMMLFGAVTVLFVSGGYYVLNYRIIIDKELQVITNVANEMSLHLNSRLIDFTLIGLTMASAPVIKEALLQSNAEFSALSDSQRDKKITTDNQQWIKTKDNNDPFIQQYMTNSVADFLQQQQKILPQKYGEIFLTNRYGVMIATTGKLTTLAHAHKYWWQASFSDGQGQIFLDDRGFDTSVGGYVLGIVIPVKNNNELVGILKCNINIMEPLADVLREFSLSHPGKLQIARTGGLIVFEHDVIPLTSRLEDDTVNLLFSKENAILMSNINNQNHLLAFSSIGITQGTEEISFGGNPGSLDHIKGNKGERWYVVITQSEQSVMDNNINKTLVIVYVGMAFTLFTAIIALFLGRLASRPIVDLAKTAENLGEGNFNARSSVHSNDEIGSLSISLNTMAKQFQATIVARDELISEIEQQSADLKIVKNKAEEANRAKGIFIANMSHEFRTPLNAVLGFSQEMLNDPTLSHTYHEYAKMINHSGHHQLALINDVLAMSSLEDGRSILNNEIFDLNELITDVTNKSIQAAKKKNIAFSHEYTARLPQCIITDADKLQQILSNVIDNAIKFTQSGKVTLYSGSYSESYSGSQASTDDNSIVLLFDVEDSGIGIPLKFHERIFQAFFQLDEDNEKSGTGLGLTIVQRFLVLMGGHISLDSTAGKGSIFHITLPVKVSGTNCFGTDKVVMQNDVSELQEDEFNLIRAEIHRLRKKTVVELAQAVFMLDVDRVQEISSLIKTSAPRLEKVLVTGVNNLDFKNSQELLRSYRE